ncbi:hypothetical protein NMG60_11016515 [Bertholletia excelsa]
MVAAVSATPNDDMSPTGGAHQNPKRPQLVTSRLFSSTSSLAATSSTSSSSYSSSPSSSSSRQCLLSLVSRKKTTTTSMSESSSAIKRIQSAERRRLAHYPGNAVEMSTAAKLLITSTRRLSVSFQGGSFSLPCSKMKQLPEQRKATAAKNTTMSSLTRSMDFTAANKKIYGSGNVPRAMRQSVMIDNANPDYISAANSDLITSDTESFSSGSTEGVQEGANVARNRGGPRGIVVPARFMQETTNRIKNNGLKSVAASKPNGMRKSFVDGTASPSRLVTSPAASLSKASPSTSVGRNGRASMISNNLSNTPSILSFAVYGRKGKFGENKITDAHLSRLLYNRHLQWRFINARADAAMSAQKFTAEQSLYKAWVTTSKLRHSVKAKRQELQMLQQSLKLYSILKGQMRSLDDWECIDRDHSCSLSEAFEALQASTVQLPVVGNIKVDIQNVKNAVGSAVNVMQSAASSICTLLTKVDQANSLVSELVNISTMERALLDQCTDLLSTLTTLQVEESSLRTNMLQLQRVQLQNTSRKAEFV